jgi:Glycosyl hydrolase family 98 C-terminal domain/Glycosyl hydrolase family 98/Domain of Unknown Function (DUF1080)/Bacterial Ig-like domain (group 4)
MHRRIEQEHHVTATSSSWRARSNRRTGVFLAVGALLLSFVVGLVRPPAAHGATMRRPIDSAHPLLLMQLVMGYNIGFDPDFPDDNNKHWDVAAAWQALPDDVKPYVAFVLHPGHNSFLTVANARKWVEDNLAEGAALHIPMLALWGETPTTGSDALTWIQHLYTTYPNFIGTEVSELTSATGSIPGLLQLANANGGYHVQSSKEEDNILGGKLESSSYWNSVIPYAANFIYSPKDVHKNFDAANTQAMGDWLSGVVGNWGPYFDAYTYYGCSIQGAATNGGGDRCSRSYPEEAIGQTMLDQYLQGATVYTLENQLDTPAVGDLYTPTFWQSVLPAFRYIIAHASPSKAQVVANVKVAFSEANGSMYSLPDTETSSGRVTFFEGLSEDVPDIANTQGLFYYPRSSGRYYAIPRLPKLASSSVVSEFPSVITSSSYTSSLQGLNNKLAYFNARYPAISSGDAFVEHIGSQYLVYNNKYSSSTTETATIPLTGTPFSQLSLPELTPDTFAMVDTSSTGMHLLLDDYLTDRTQDLLKPAGARAMEFEESFDKYAYVPAPKDSAMRTNTIRVHSATEPSLTISGYDGHYTYSQAWDSAAHVYTLTVHSDGAVDVSLDRSAGDGAGWTKTDDAGAYVGYSGTWNSAAGTSGDYLSTAHSTSTAGSAVSYGFSGTSVEWVGDTSVAGGTADVAVDGTTVATGINTSAATAASGVVLFKATGLAATTHTIKVTARSGTIDIDRFSYVPSQIAMLNTIDLQPFTSGTAANDPAFLPGDDGWVVKGGILKLLPYVKPWFSDLSVYNTKASWGDLTYQASVRTVKGTPGGLLVRANAQNKTGYYVMLDPTRANPNKDTTVSSLKIYRNGTTLLASAPTSLTLATNTWYTVKVVATGSTLQVYINGTLEITTTDSTYTTGETGVRLESNTGGVGDFVEVDNVSVTVGATSVYTSDFSSWSTATDWVSEGPLVFSPLPVRTTFDYPWEWVPAGGTWSVVNDATVFTSGRNGVEQGVAGAGEEDLLTAGPTTYTNYLYRSLFRFTSGSTPRAGLLVRAADANNLYEVALDGSAGRVSLRKRVAGTWTTVSSGSAFSFTTGTWYTVGIQLVGDEITVTMNGATVISTRDSSLAAGAVGYSVGNGTTAQFDDAWVAQLPSAAGAPSYATYPPAAASIGAHTIAGFDPVYVKTGKDAAPVLPTTVTALYADNTTASVAVTWPAATAAQLATSTTPYQGGQSQGHFALAGTVSGTSLKPAANVTVMPRLASALTTTVHTTVGATDFMPLAFNSVSFTTGTSTFSRTLYVTWDTIPSTTAAGTFAVTGTINDYPYGKATATVTVS